MLYFTPIRLPVRPRVTRLRLRYRLNGTHSRHRVSPLEPIRRTCHGRQSDKSLITPASVDLKRNQVYTFVFHKDGYKDDSFVITSGTSGWVWGNVLIGGLIGGLSISPAEARASSHRNLCMSRLPHSLPMTYLLRLRRPLSRSVMPVAEPIPAALKQVNEPTM